MATYLKSKKAATLKKEEEEEAARKKAKSIKAKSIKNGKGKGKKKKIVLDSDIESSESEEEVLDQLELALREEEEFVRNGGEIDRILQRDRSSSLSLSTFSR